ncbi:MAG: alcohol dehydrogenase catalytic domain-containing protein [Eubacterium sp.]|nr:alcohol dehydrogenase catalytic domain-containing protein [Eubacterium sp.]
MSNPDKVRSVVMTGPGKVEVQEFPWPDHLEDGAVLAKVEMSGICGTDKHAFDGDNLLYGGTESEQEMVYPHVPGHEISAIVVDMGGKGSDIEYSGKDLKVGDRITVCPNVICGHCWYCRNIHGFPFCPDHQGIGMTYSAKDFPHFIGGWSEYVYLPPKAWVYKCREDLTVEEAALSEIFVVTALLDRAKMYSQIDARGGFHFGDTVVIQGLGAIGMTMTAKARMLGAGNIIVLDYKQKNLELAKEFGADIAINLNDLSEKDLIDEIKGYTEGRGADVCVEGVGTPDAVSTGLNLLRRGGTYCETGNFADTGTVPLNIHRQFAAKNVLFIGNTNHPHDQYYVHHDMMVKHRKEFPWHKLVTHRFDLDQCMDAMKASYEPDALKVEFVPGLNKKS